MSSVILSHAGLLTHEKQYQWHVTIHTYARTSYRRDMPLPKRTFWSTCEKQQDVAANRDLAKTRL